AIANQGRKLLGKNTLVNPQAIMYSLPRSDFHDITVGDNDYFGLGFGITGNPAGPGYDLASGLGTPIANLVIRDLGNASGTSFVAAPLAAGGSPSSGFFRTYRSLAIGGWNVGGSELDSTGSANQGYLPRVPGLSVNSISSVKTAPLGTAQLNAVS